MDKIQVDINLINNSIIKIEESKTRIDDAITKISLLTGSVEDNWKGSSALYVTNLLSCSNDMYVMIDNIDSLIELLTNISNSLENNFNKLQSKSNDLYQ